MRDIRIRAWNKEEERWFIFENASLYEKEDGIPNTVLIVDFSDNYVVEQYTGLKDKSGKDIYEGDIISFENEKGLARVLWLDGKAMFGLKWLDCGVEDELDYWNVCRGPAEVIGNIHEYLELLESEK